MRRLLIAAAAMVLLLSSCGTSARYGWERERNKIPAFADLVLCYGGGLVKEPRYWSEDRFSAQVSYTDEKGREHWLYDAFLFIDDHEGRTGKGLSLSPSPGQKNGNKLSWHEFIDYWLAPGGAIDALANCVEETASRIGAPARKRVIIMTMPDPVQFECFADKSSSTTYWGDGLDFSKSEDQVKAYKWFIDECRSRFALCKCKYLELGGFYVLSEDLVAKKDGLNYRYKRWDQILPEVSKYLHTMNCGLYWIPWNMAPGHDMTRTLGIDMAWMQPNAYWDEENAKPWDRTIEAIKKHDLSMEFEFEYSVCTAAMMQPGRKAPDAHWRMTKTLADVPGFKSRFREYMKQFKDAGLYGKKPIAVYAGTDTMYMLAKSREPDDVRLYHELCHYLLDSPLRADK
ncbi:MAG: DUF4855 domain-containing protein [Bacteroidales bacterium]|nr:DUF4855 domain-containing protein [Bacteroidales bacterium]